MVDRSETPRPAGSDSLAWVERLVAEKGVSAVIDIVGDDVLAAVDVWIVKKSPRRFEVTRVPVEPDTTNQSGRLALKAIEALRGSLLETGAVKRAQPSDAAPRPAQAAQAEQTEKPPFFDGRLRIEVGAAAVTSLDGVGPAVLPILRLGWASRPWLVVQAALAGFGSGATVTTSVGQADVAQQYAVLAACFRFRSQKRLSPFVALGAGALRTAIEGRSGLGTEGHDVNKWSFLLEGSLGIGLRLHPRYYVTLAAHVHLAEPYVAIHIADTVGATTGRPNLLLTLTLGAWL